MTGRVAEEEEVGWGSGEWWKLDDVEALDASLGVVERLQSLAAVCGVGGGHADGRQPDSDGDWRVL
jgi:hypothetical protein